MAEAEQFLLVFQFYDGTKVVLEFESEHYLSGKFQAAKDLKVWVRRLSAEEFDTEEYYGVQHYDMRDSGTSKIFFLEQWRNNLMTEDGKSFTEA